MRRALLTAVTLLALAGTAQAGPDPRPMAPASKPTAPAEKPATHSELDGTKWSLKVVPDAKAMEKGEQSFPDTLVFENNKVEMTECVKFGFRPSAYTTAKIGGKWKFSAEQTSKAGGKAFWTAEIKGTSITGKMKSIKEDGTVLNYTFEGVRQ